MLVDIGIAEFSVCVILGKCLFCRWKPWDCTLLNLHQWEIFLYEFHPRNWARKTMAVKETNQNTFSKSQNLFSKNTPKNPRTWETSETNLFSCELRSISFFFHGWSQLFPLFFLSNHPHPHPCYLHWCSCLYIVTTNMNSSSLSPVENPAA